MANRNTRIDALQIKDLSITDAQISTTADIALSKIVATTPGYIIVGAATTGVPTYVAMSGDVTISDAGATAIGADKVLDTMIRLQNDGQLRARNFADSGDINILKINTSDVIVLDGTAWAAAIKVGMLDASGATNGYFLQYSSAGGGTMVWADVAGGYVQFTDIIASELPASGDIDGSNAAFVIANTPKTGTLQVYLNGLLQQPGSGLDYTLATATVTFVVAPELGDIVLFSYCK